MDLIQGITSRYETILVLGVMRGEVLKRFDGVG